MILMLPLGYLPPAPVHTLISLEPLQGSAGAAADVEHVRALQHEAGDHDEIDERAMLRKVWSFDGTAASRG